MRFTRTPHERGIFCNRTLNLRSIKAIGYDMDYTLIHYHSAVWERAAYEHCKQNFLDKGWPIGALEFDPLLVSRGRLRGYQKKPGVRGCPLFVSLNQVVRLRDDPEYARYRARWQAGRESWVSGWCRSWWPGDTR